MSINQTFYELLQVAVGNRHALSAIPSAEEWEEIYEIAKKQSLVGVCFFGVKRLPQKQLPPPRRFRQWAVKAIRLQEKNQRVSKECGEVSNAFNKAGFDVVILKGQGNLAGYPEELNTLRTPGDIDVWAMPKSKDKPPVRTVIEFCQRVKKGDYVYYHNLDFPILKKTTVEVHYRPTWLFCPWRDRVLQRWMKVRFVGVDYDGYKIPTVEFNVVFQLLHIYKHLFEEGIGLRQLLDYYWVLTPACPERQSEYRRAREDVMPLLKRLGLMKFSGAVMFVLQEVFGIQKENMLCEPNVKEGRKLLSEIMIAGNFGHFDDRYDFAEATAKGSMQFRGKDYAWLRLKRNFNFVGSYPMEVLFEPPFRVYHWVWRTFRLWRY